MPKQLQQQLTLAGYVNDNNKRDKLATPTQQGKARKNRNGGGM
jgi:hypothetical protein